MRAPGPANGRSEEHCLIGSIVDDNGGILDVGNRFDVFHAHDLLPLFKQAAGNHCPETFGTRKFSSTTCAARAIKTGVQDFKAYERLQRKDFLALDIVFNENAFVIKQGLFVGHGRSSICGKLAARQERMLRVGYFEQWKVPWAP